jgi:hypothetical protein
MDNRLVSKTRVFETLTECTLSGSSGHFHYALLVRHRLGWLRASNLGRRYRVRPFPAAWQHPVKGVLRLTRSIMEVLIIALELLVVLLKLLIALGVLPT